jgi:hypothetical protein
MSNNLNQHWPQQPLNDLRVDAGFRENLSGRSLNAKLAGILPVGIYNGFDVIASTGLDVVVGSAGVNAAIIEVPDPVNTAIKASLTASMPEGMQKSIPVPVGAECYLVLKVFYRAEAYLEVEDKTRISIEVVTDLTAPAYSAYLTLATINAPSGTTQIGQGHIRNVRKIDLGTEQEAKFNALPIGATDKTYTIAKGAGALAGEFAMYDTETGGYLKLVAIHTLAGVASLSVTSKSEGMPIAKFAVVKNGNDIELQAIIVMNSPNAEKIYTDFRAFDAHNASNIGWVQSFVESVAGGDVLTSVDLLFTEDGSPTETVPEGIGSASSSNSGMITEFNEPLAQRYLGLGSEAKSAKIATAAGTATHAGDSSKLGGIPAKNFKSFHIDHDGPLKDKYPAKSTNPDELGVPFAVIRHANNPTGGSDYFIETIAYGADWAMVRHQTATLVIDGQSAASSTANTVFTRSISGELIAAGEVRKTGWSSAADSGPWQGVSGIGDKGQEFRTGEFITLLEGLGAFNNGYWMRKIGYGDRAGGTLDTYIGYYHGTIGSIKSSVGSIDLSGCLIEVYGATKNDCMIRITTPTRISEDSKEMTGREYIYTADTVSQWREIATIGISDNSVRSNAQNKEVFPVIGTGNDDVMSIASMRAEFTRRSANKASVAPVGSMMFAALWDSAEALPFFYEYGSIITISSTVSLRPAMTETGSNQTSNLPAAGTKWVCQGYSRYADQARPHASHFGTLWARWS